MLAKKIEWSLPHKSTWKIGRMIDQTYQTEHDKLETLATEQGRGAKLHKHPEQVYIYGNGTNPSSVDFFPPEPSCNKQILYITHEHKDNACENVP